MSLIGWMAALSLLITGCASVPQTVLPTPPHSPEEQDIAWRDQHWRTCLKAKTCPQRTPKTITPTWPLPRSENPSSQQKPQPERAALAQSNQPLVIHFPYGLAIPTREGEQELEAVLTRILPTHTLRLEGRTDDIGSRQFNERLARQRARFVEGWLKRRGVANPIEIDAQGKCCYAADNKTDEGRAANRRVTILLLPTTNRKEISQ